MPRSKWTQCPYCEKWIPKKYLRHHKEVCRVRRGLDPKPEKEPEEEIFVAKKGESISEFLERILESK